MTPEGPPAWWWGDLGLPTPFDVHGASFIEVLRRSAPGAVPDILRSGDQRTGPPPNVVEGTTVLAMTYRDGVIVAGDRRATAGHVISKKDMRKVFPADRYSAIAISGVAGPGMELAKVFATELEHYEKVEGEPLSLEGKANKLAHMVRAHLPFAMQGLVVVPLFAGVEVRDGRGRIYEYDPAGGRYQSADYAAAGSGGRDARGALKRVHRLDASEEDAVRLGVGALFDAAEEDSATGGPDLIRRVYPIVSVIDRDGYRELDEEVVAAHVQAVVDEREERIIADEPWER
ncbi:MAG TPA: proteasome subunit beta [Nitriliruptorales bacterium]|nr:proteasome subunit beta [Nitriliruptorales bacterium]